ncbi:MAG: TlyA family RNA methyltransferase [Peptococcaceae bacterium]|jgi:23S rRNA (cytidine1920-2'-O)/16S rRNA (cytidine1409-2'-O)-methyltransferase|nr:TlyA family RNA methyltransferase [Peptococcaceae bacterium]MDH7525335.1 TlyA family RNA methyltransferase [Peptococcaceae bacterium]
MGKERLDQVLVKKGLAASREKGKALIMAGKVFVNRVRADKPGVLVSDSDEIELKGQPFPYVSRGGLKLEKALRKFRLNMEGKVVMDVGASTGGFTHCALLNGASRVYAVDVGYGQLDWSLRQDRRVVCLERKNARHLTGDDIGEAVDIVTIDVSFISLRKILPAVYPFLKYGGDVVALIKPQFEAGPEKVGKKGVVRDARVHVSVIRGIVDYCGEIGLSPLGLDFSPVAGPEGNIEFLLWLNKGREGVRTDWEQVIENVVREAREELTGLGLSKKKET